MLRPGLILGAVAFLSVFTVDVSSSAPQNSPPTEVGPADISGLVIDLSSNEASIKLTPEMKSINGIYLIWHRATLGAKEHSDDTAFARRLRETYNLHLDAGAYHVMYTKYSGTVQADKFADSVEQACVPGKPVVLAVDWEAVCPASKTCDDDEKKTALPKDVSDFITEAKARFSVSQIVVYTDLNTIDHYRPSITPNISNNPLWIATYLRRFYAPNTIAEVIRLSEKGKPASTLTKIEVQAAHKKIEDEIKNDYGRLGYIFPVKTEISPWADWILWQYGSDDKSDITEGPTTDITLELQNRLADKSFFNGTRDAYSGAFKQATYVCPTTSSAASR
jgi:GH25 family lysozyme M1 (1,4-beta-N-acetylmuramidase)